MPYSPLRFRDFNRLLGITALKSVLHIAIYILLGLMLAFFINSTAQAAELDYTDYPRYDEEPAYEYTPATPTDLSRLSVTVRAQDTGNFLHGAVFDVCRAIDDVFIAQIATNQFGEAFVDLPAGEYYLREVIAPAGFLHDASRIYITIGGGELYEVTLWRFPIPEPPPPPPPQDLTPAPEFGRPLATSRAHGTGNLLRGVVFEVRRTIDDVFMTQIVTNQFGEASVNPPAGDYFLRELVAPAGFIPNPNKCESPVKNKQEHAKE